MLGARRRFPTTKRWSAAVALINASDTATLSKLLPRMLEALPEKQVRAHARLDARSIQGL